MSVGFFTCSQEQFVGESACLMLPQDAIVEVVTKVAGTLEVEVSLDGDVSQDVLEHTFREGIADAIGVSIEDVSKLTVTEIVQGQGSRRLQAMQVKRYEVSYEVLLRSSIGADVALERANLLLEPSSEESQVFRQALEETSGVAEVGEIEATVLPRTFEDQSITSALHNQTAEQEYQGSAGLSLAAAIIIVFSALACVLIGVAGSVLWKRKIAAAKDFLGDAEVGFAGSIVRVPSNTLLNSTITDAEKKRGRPLLDLEEA